MRCFAHQSPHNHLRACWLMNNILKYKLFLQKNIQSVKLYSQLYLLTTLSICLVHGSFNYIYPSQRQNLLPTLEISTQNFHNFQNFGKKFQNLEFFSKISKTTKGPPLTSKGPPPPHYPITKFSFFSRVSKARGI